MLISSLHWMEISIIIHVWNCDFAKSTLRMIWKSTFLEEAWCIGASARHNKHPMLLQHDSDPNFWYIEHVYTYMLCYCIPPIYGVLDRAVRTLSYDSLSRELNQASPTGMCIHGQKIPPIPQKSILLLSIIKRIPNHKLPSKSEHK